MFYVAKNWQLKDGRLPFIQNIIFSVVTSVSVVTEDDPPEKRSKYEEEYHRYILHYSFTTFTHLFTLFKILVRGLPSTLV